MNLFKKCFLAAMVMVAMSSYGQITVNACNPLFDNQDFVFANLGPDATGRNVFETIPITGDQPCSGVGVCELKIYWNDAMSRWELIADDGDANFNTNFLIYFNNETSTPNPPSLILGNWIENTAITGGTCGGDGATSINTMTGDIQDTTLSVEVIGQVDAIEFYPNPTNGIFNLTGISNLDVDVKIFSVTGKLVLNEKPMNDKVDVSSLSKGIYFVEIKWNNQSILKKLIKK